MDQLLHELIDDQLFEEHLETWSFELQLNSLECTGATDGLTFSGYKLVN